MKEQSNRPFRAWVTGLAWTMFISRASADSLFQSYCSTQNTGSDYAGTTSIYASDGSCYNQCLAGYAFAIVQWQQCWCSNYIPAQQVSVSLCDAPCPGYDTDLCGNQTAGLFGYIQLTISPSGTAGAVSSTSSNLLTTSSLSTTSTSTTSSSSSSSSSSSATPSIEVVTLSGVTVTQFVTPSPLPTGEGSTTSSAFPVSEQKQSHGLSGGAIAGIVIGALAGVALAALLIFLLLRRKSRNSDDSAVAVPTGRQGMTKLPGRDFSVLSKAGLIGRNRPATANEDSHAQGGSNSARHSMMLGAGAEVNPDSPLDHGADSNGRRHSRPFVYDQRLNPSALFANQEALGSRVSMQDTQDYSRTLNIMNPDPRASFDSRFSERR